MDALTRGHYIQLQRYVSDFKGFAPFSSDIVTNIFRFHKKYSMIAKDIHEMMLRRAIKEFELNQTHNLTTVSIHIRLTDFGGHLENLFNVAYATPDYFSNAMQYFANKYKVL